MDIRTKRIRDAQPGEIVAVPLGGIKPTAIKIESLFCVIDPPQRCAQGEVVVALGYSTCSGVSFEAGRIVSVNLGAP